MHCFAQNSIDWPYSSHYSESFRLYFHGSIGQFKGGKLHLKPIEVIYSVVLCCQHTLYLIARQKKEGRMIHRAGMMICTTSVFTFAAILVSKDY